MPPVVSRTTSLPSIKARATSLRGRASSLTLRVGVEVSEPDVRILEPEALAPGFFESAGESAKRAKEVVVSPAGIVVDGALKPAGKFSKRTSMAPSKPSCRSAVTFMGRAPPFHTRGLVGSNFTVKSGRGGRIVKR